MKPQTTLELSVPAVGTVLEWVNDKNPYSRYVIVADYTANGIKQVTERPARHKMTVEEAESYLQYLQQAVNNAKQLNQRLDEKC